MRYPCDRSPLLREGLARLGAFFRDFPIPKENWTVHDICSSKPFPYEEKFFDFAICSPTLEDVRDPIRVCEELARVSKAGYIEVPSILTELTMGVEGNRPWVGYAHHRWLIDLSDDQVRALLKPHFLAASHATANFSNDSV
jgi:hypothetical protein